METVEVERSEKIQDLFQRKNQGLNSEKEKGNTHISRTAKCRHGPIIASVPYSVKTQRGRESDEV